MDKQKMKDPRIWQRMAGELAALDTLAGLHRDGKLIGVISHVAALKERIGTQIQVTPKTGGRSAVSGPGCSSV